MAACLLDLCDNEALAGDVLEEFEFRQSRVWLWRQVIVAVGCAVFGRRDPSRPLKLSSGPLVSEPVAGLETGGHVINLTASPLHGAGGLSIATFALLMTAVVPGVWWILLATAATGAVIGVAIALLRTSHSHRNPNRDPGRTLMKSPESPGGH
jgi:hypothetical protein